MLKRILLVILGSITILSTGCVPDKYRLEKEFSSSGSGKGQILSANDLCITKNGNIVISDAGNTRVQIIKPDGTFVRQMGAGGRKGYKLRSISGIGVNPLTSDVWVCDQKSSKIVVFNKSGKPFLKIKEKVSYPMDICVDKSGNAYVIMTKKPEIYKYNPNGEFLGKIGGTGKSALLFPTSILFDNNHLYVADFGGARVLKLSMKGELEKEYKQKGEYEEMLGPSSVFVDKKGNLYILDLGEIPVVVLNPEGELISKIGEFGNEKGKFLYPKGVATLKSGEIFVLDNSRNCILSFKRKPE